MKIANALRQHGKVPTEITGMHYPPPPMNQLIATVLGWGFLIGMVLMFFGNMLFSTVKFEPGVRFVKWMNERQGMVVMCLFLMQIAAGNLLNTGAFEVYFNDDLVFSRLDTGGIPDTYQLLKALERYGDLPINAI